MQLFLDRIVPLPTSVSWQSVLHWIKVAHPLHAQHQSTLPGSQLTLQINWQPTQGSSTLLECIHLQMVIGRIIPNMHKVGRVSCIFYGNPLWPTQCSQWEDDTAMDRIDHPL